MELAHHTLGPLVAFACGFLNFIYLKTRLDSFGTEDHITVDVRKY